MDISKLQNRNGYIKIAAMDHRDSLKKFMPEDKLSDFKDLLTNTFANFCTAILVDPEFGMSAIRSAEKLKLAVMLTREKTGYVDNPEGRLTELYEDFDSKTLKEMGADAVKVLLYYNSESPNLNAQLEVIKKVREETLQENLPFLVEPITYEIKGRPYNKGEETIKAVNDLTNLCDVLKLEFPIEVSDDGSNIETASAILSEIKNKITIPWVLLSRGMKFDNYKQVLKICKNYDCKGFAVGRAVWQEVSEQPDWELMQNFIRTIALNRMRELSEIYDA